MQEKSNKEEQKINIHLMSFDLRKDLLTSKEISLKISTKSVSPKCTDLYDDNKATATIPVEKIQNSNIIFNVKLKISEIKEEKTNEITIWLKMKNKLGIEHKIAFANINYTNLLDMVNDDKDENEKINNKSGSTTNKSRKNKYFLDKAQKIPIYISQKQKLKDYNKSKKKEFSNSYSSNLDDLNDDPIVGYMKIQLSLFQSYNNNTQYCIDEKNNNKKCKKNCIFFSTNKKFSINLHKFKNYHISEKQNSNLQKSDKPYQIKKQFQNML